MADFYKGVIPILDPDVAAHTDTLHPKGQAKGLVERDYDVQPEAMFAQPSEMEVIPQSEWDARFDEEEATESSLEHLFLRGGKPAFQNVDQNGFPDCWGHSTCHSAMFNRLLQNLPVLRFNGVGVATLLKQTNGGWGALSAQLARDGGLPVVGDGPGQWPYQSRKGKDTPELRADMAKHKSLEEWVDLTKQVYDQNLAQAQIATCGFNNIPGPRDYNWWSHSVCGVRWVRTEKNVWGQLIYNSWGESWGHFGLSVLIGSKCVANGALGIRVSAAA